MHEKIQFHDYEATVWGDLEVNAEERGVRGSGRATLRYIERMLTEQQRIGISMLVLRGLVIVKRDGNPREDELETDNYWVVRRTKAGREVSKRF